MMPQIRAGVGGWWMNVGNIHEPSTPEPAAWSVRGFGRKAFYFGHRPRHRDRRRRSDNELRQRRERFIGCLLT